VTIVVRVGTRSIVENDAPAPVRRGGG